MSEVSTTKVISPRGMFSYPHLEAPQKAKPGQTPKHSITLVLTPAHLATEEGAKQFAAMQAAAIAAATDKFGATYKLPNGTTIPIAQALKDGIIRNPFRRDALAKGYPEGSVFINARSVQRPGVVYAYADANGKPAVIPTDKIKEVVYPGSEGRLSLNAFGYDTDGNKGVSFGLNNVQKLGEGERLDGRAAAEDEFTADLSAAPADLNALI